MESINERQLAFIKYWQKCFDDGSLPKRNNVLIPLMFQVVKDIRIIQGTLKEKE